MFISVTPRLAAGAAAVGTGWKHMPVAEPVDLSPKERALIRGVSLALDNYEPFPAFFAPRSGALE